MKAPQDILSVHNNGTYYNRKTLHEMLQKARQPKIRLDRERGSR